jgi:hypothetical protein
LIYIVIVDIKPGLDEQAYGALEDLKGDGGVTPLLVGRIFEEADVLLLLHSHEMEALDDYVIKYVRNMEAAEELVVIPIYEFTLLPSFESIIEIEEEPYYTAKVEAPAEVIAEPDEFLLFMARIDVAPRKDSFVHEAVVSLEQEDEAVIPLMAGHTFHSNEFDLVLFFLSKGLEEAWDFGKRLRAIDGVWDTDFSLIAHFEALVPLDRFREFVSGDVSVNPEGIRNE